MPFGPGSFNWKNVSPIYASKPLGFVPPVLVNLAYKWDCEVWWGAKGIDPYLSKVS